MEVEGYVYVNSFSFYYLYFCGVCTQEEFYSSCFRARSKGSILLSFVRAVVGTFTWLGDFEGFDVLGINPRLRH